VPTITITFDENGKPVFEESVPTPPASDVVTNEAIAIFDGVDGEAVKDSGTLISDLATAAQGLLADSAVQPDDNANTLGSGVATDGYVLTADGSGTTAWEATGVSASTVTGPASATDEHIAVFDGITGKVVKDGTVAVTDLATSAQGTLANSALQPGEAIEEVEAVSGGAGFVNVSGAVTLDLSTGRVFQNTATGNITGPTFMNVPAAAGNSPSWKWVLKIDAIGGYTLTSTPTVTFVDGSSFADADMSANAVNTFVFWVDGAVTYGALVTNGSLALDPYVIPFPAAGTALIVVARAETIDLSNALNVEADGTTGTGTLSYAKDGVAISPIVSTAFVAGEVLTVTLSGSTTATAGSIPRYV
jgi:hypothetical protein